MAERESIISGIVAQRKIEREHAESVEEAKKEIPGFTSRLSALVQANVAQPEVHLVHFDNYYEGPLYTSYGNSESEYSTKLKASISTDEGTIAVDIGTTIYPSIEEIKGKWKVDVQDLDYYLVISGEDWIFESKSKDSDMPRDPMTTIIGHKYNSWPSWRRPVDPDGANQFKNLLGVLESGEGVEFSGSTPPLKKLDESTKPTTPRYLLGRFK